MTATLSGRILITGATGGIGQAIARAFAAQGAELILTGRRAEVLEPLARELGATTLVADLADRDALARLAEAAGPLDVCIANAALPATGRLDELEQDEIDTILEVNLAAPIAMSKALLPGMLERGRGHFVFISSLSGKVASPMASMYNATKFGLRGFSLALREDLHRSGVSSSVVLPGFISEAGMFHDSGVKLPRGVGTRTPAQVADGVLRAVREDRAEVIVAPFGLRFGAEVAGIAPGLGARMGRRLGADEIARGLAAGQRDKRPTAGR